MQDILSISLEFYALAARREDVRATLQEYFERYGRSLSTLIQAGIDDGEFDASITPEHVAFNLVAQFEGLVLLWAMQAGDFDLAQQTTTAVTHLIQGLQKK
jgi:hypothetical protein